MGGVTSGFHLASLAPPKVKFKKKRPPRPRTSKREGARGEVKRVGGLETGKQISRLLGTLQPQQKTTNKKTTKREKERNYTCTA